MLTDEEPGVISNATPLLSIPSTLATSTDVVPSSNAWNFKLNSIVVPAFSSFLDIVIVPSPPVASSPLMKRSFVLS